MPILSLKLTLIVGQALKQQDMRRKTCPHGLRKPVSCNPVKPFRAERMDFHHGTQWQELQTSSWDSLTNTEPGANGKMCYDTSKDLGDILNFIGITSCSGACDVKWNDIYSVFDNLLILSSLIENCGPNIPINMIIVSRCYYDPHSCYYKIVVILLAVTMTLIVMFLTVTMSITAFFGYYDL